MSRIFGAACQNGYVVRDVRAAMVEISDISGSKGSFFEHIRKVAAGWDGSDLIREVGGR